MTSRELLTLLEGLPETSRYKGALRALPYGLQYEWAPEEYRAAALARQLAPLNEDGDMTIPRPLYESYFSPVERMKIEAEQEREATRLERGRNFVLGNMLGLRKAVS